jgi:U3 small nucleolar ribonucleoprotein protein IMP3
VNQVNESLRAIRHLEGKEYVEFKKEQMELIAVKLYNMGVLDKLDTLDRKKYLTVAMLCKRRLSYLCMELRMGETVKMTSDYIQHGHVRIGPQIIRDPAFIVSRGLEDFITWSVGSKIRETVKQFNGNYDDYEELNA